MATYRAGIIGLARMGSWVDDLWKDSYPAEVPSSQITMMRAIPRIELVAACDINPDMRAKFQEKWGFSNLYADYKEMLAKEKLDLVGIVTSWASVQGKVAADVAEFGVKGIYCEKPVADSAGQMDRIVRAVEEHRTAFVVPYVRRYTPGYVKIHDLIQSGAIGKVLSAHVIAVGTLMHGATHYFDVLNYFCGDPDPAWCVGRTEDVSHLPADSWARQDPNGSGYVEMKNGIRYTFEGVSSGLAQYVVSGTEGKIWAVNECRDIELWKKSEEPNSTRLVRQDVPCPPQTKSTMLAAMEDLVHSMDTGELTRSNIYTAARTLEMALAIHESQRRGNCRVDFPLENRSLAVETK